MKRFTLITSAYLFLIKNSNILLSRRYNTGYEDGNYGVPSGHLEAHETIRACCIREANEEIGITLAPKDLVLVHVMHRRHMDERIDFFFVTSKWKGEIRNREADKCDDLSWFALDDLPANTIGYIRVAIQLHRQPELYSEFGFGNQERGHTS